MQSLWPVIAFAAGYLVKMLTDWIDHKRAVGREREGREAERRHTIALRRIDFQRATLVELQDSTAELARHVGAIHHNDVVKSREAERWIRGPASEATSEGFATTMRRVVVLAARVSSPTLRERADNFRIRCSGIVFAQSEAESHATIGEVSEGFAELNSGLGAILRHLDQEQDTLMHQD